jgi:Uma2 family endonuclease
MDLAASLMGLLREMLGGKALPECPIVTAGGVKVADVVWCSQAFLERHADEFRSWAAALSRAPDLCIEIKSPANTLGELREKLQFYLDAGATEVWIVHPDGSIEIFHAPGARQGGVPGGSIFPLDLDRIRCEVVGSTR